MKREEKRFQKRRETRTFVELVPELESMDGPRVGTSVCPVSRGILQGVVLLCGGVRYSHRKLKLTKVEYIENRLKYWMLLFFAHINKGSLRPL